jgi:hypothetical protein
MPATKEKIADMRPYVERALKDEDVRDNVLAAFAAARDVYDDLLGGRDMKSAVTRAATDKDIQDNLRLALDELREAAERVQGKRDHTGRNTTLLMVGIAIGILMNPVTGPGTRRWIKEKVLGPSDDFTYGGNSDAYGETNSSPTANETTAA